MQGTPGADINVTKAWDITKGDPSIIVAVMDCGVSNNHPDLPASRIVSGYNAIYDNYDPTPEKFKTINHGNACAGIIAAEMDNEIGIAGIAPYCKIMPIKIGIGGADQPGYPNPNTPPRGDDVKADELTRAFNHAVENNASIINCSWYAGPDFIDMNSTAQYAISDVVGKGRNGKGIIIVFCIGNLAMHDGEPPYWTQKDKDGYLGWPSRLNIPGVISVGASDRNDKQANYSPHSYNAKETPSYFIDVVAPSHKKYDNDVDVVEGTCVMTIDEVGSEYGYNYEDQLSHEQNGCPDATGDISAYDYACNFGGTSAAAPQVSAVAALMLSVNPELTYLDVEDLIKGTADKKGPYNYNVSVSYPGTSREMGAGRLNALRAVERANEFTYAKNADLAIKDVQGDLYAEPNPEENTWISPDIWVRNTDDGRIHQYTEEKLNYDPGKKNTFFVYVRVKNKGLQYSQGYEKIIAYWAKASTSVNWPAPWDGSANQNSPFPLGNRIALPKTIPPIAPGGETIISFLWSDVPDPKLYEAQFGTNDRGHFCFLARIEQFPDAPYGMASPEKDGDLYGNIRNNNNIASKNVIISRTYGLTKQFPKRCILVSNVSNPTSAIDLVFRAPLEERAHSIFDNGDVKIEVAPQVYQAWTLGGMLGQKILAAGNQIKLTGDNATLKNIKLPLNALYNVCVTYSPKVNVFGTTGGVYSLDIIQKVGKTTIGGERFQFVEESQPSAMPFLVKETSDQKLLGQICTQQDSKLVIEDQRTSATTKRVKLTDIFGKEIGTFDYYLTGTFEISNLLPGAYLVNIVELETGKIFNQRFIFMK